MIRVLVGAFLLSLSGGSPTPEQNTVVAYAQQLIVAEIDPKLPRERLDRWLESIVVPGGEIHWSEGCDFKGPAAPEDPLCVGIRIKVDASRGVIGYFIVGSQGQGISGKPRILSLLSVRMGVDADGIPKVVASRSARKLSDLPRQLAELKDDRAAMR